MACVLKRLILHYHTKFHEDLSHKGGSVAEWLACWTQAQKCLGSNRSRNTVG